MIDLHIHTTASDGSQTMEHILKQCIRDNIKLIAITDHWRTKRYSEDFYVTDMDSYLLRVDALKEQAKNQGITVLAGLEVDFTEAYGFPIEAEAVKGFNRLDFAVFEYVNTRQEHWGVLNGKPLAELFALRDKLTIPIGLAHNDFYHNFKDNYEEMLYEMSQRNIFLELCEGEELGRQKADSLSLKKLLVLKKNLSDLDIYKGKAPIKKKKHVRNDKYYFEHFPGHLWELIKKYRLPLSVGTDNHSGTGFGNHPLADGYLEKYQLHHQLIFQAGDFYETDLSR